MIKGKIGLQIENQLSQEENQRLHKTQILHKESSGGDYGFFGVEQSINHGDGSSAPLRTPNKNLNALKNLPLIRQSKLHPKYSSQLNDAIKIYSYNKGATTNSGDQ